MSFRSESLKLCQMIVQKDAAWNCVVELGQHGVVQFKDLNNQISLFQRTFVREVRRCTELERCIRYIESEIVDACAVDHIPPLDSANVEVMQQREIYDLEQRLFELERDLREFLENEAQLKRNYNDMREFQCVLQKVEEFFSVHLEDMAKNELDAENLGDKVNDLGTPLTPLLENTHETPWFIAGVVESQKRHSFERVLFRACRRTAFVRTAEISDMFEDPETGKHYAKSVFIIFFKGQKLQDIVNRVCDGFNAKQYSCPKSSKERRLVEADVTLRLHDLRVVIEKTEKHKLELLRGAAFELPEWVRTVHLQKCVYHTLNLFTFDTSGNFFVAECWLPERELDNVFQTLQRGVEKAGSTIRPIINVLDSVEVPPTYNKTNKFTRVFQDIVDSYGVASYREMNPAPFTIISFPFLFAVMFGDLGHGLIMTVAGLAFLYYEKLIKQMKIKNEIFNTFFDGRYIIILMGMFSMYTGIIYNDLFAKSVNVFGSRWYAASGLLENGTRRAYLELDPLYAYDREAGPYLIGVDPIWNIAHNRLNFLNSMKMKASVIIGILQMTFGVLLGFLNAIFSGSAADVLTQCIPQLIFLTSIFIYLCGQIFAKWIFYWVQPALVFGMQYPGSHCAPSLLVGLINMFMFKDRQFGFQDENGAEKKHCHLNYWFPYQDQIEKGLVITAALCVPIMLFGKPLCSLMQRKKQRNRRFETSRRSTNVNVRVKLGQNEEAEAELLPALESADSSPKKMRNKSDSNSLMRIEPENSFSDVMVDQSIHTIEFVLGCISHTASYLRLWALSLAHAQLSEVLWHMVLQPAFSKSGLVSSVLLVVHFFIFFLLTVMVLVLMEGLSAFLHALRLHWVEFQSKFYVGSGKMFQPLYFKGSLRKVCAESPYL